MTVQGVPNTKYAKGVRWLAELYEKKQVSNLTAQTLNKAVEYEVSQSQAQLTEIEKVLADYELHHGKCYFGKDRCIRKNVTFR